MNSTKFILTPKKMSPRTRRSSPYKSPVGGDNFKKSYRLGAFTYILAVTILLFSVLRFVHEVRFVNNTATGMLDIRTSDDANSSPRHIFSRHLRLVPPKNEFIQWNADAEPPNPSHYEAVASNSNSIIPTIRSAIAPNRLIARF